VKKLDFPTSTDRNFTILAGVLVFGGILFTLLEFWLEHVGPLLFAGWLALAIAVIALATVLIRFGLYGLLALIGTRLVRLGQSRGQKLAEKRAAQQKLKLGEIQAMAIPEEVK